MFWWRQNAPEQGARAGGIPEAVCPARTTPFRRILSIFPGRCGFGVGPRSVRGARPLRVLPLARALPHVNRQRQTSSNFLTSPKRFR